MITIEQALGAETIRQLETIYWVVFTGALMAAIWVPRRLVAKVLAAAACLALFLAPHLYFRPTAQQIDEVRALAAADDASRRVFEDRCKLAGETVERTVDDVEGVHLDNLFPDLPEQMAGGYWPGAALPWQSGGFMYLLSFLDWEHQQFPPKRGVFGLSADPPAKGSVSYDGYRYVETSEGGVLYRHRLNSRRTAYAEDSVDRTPWSGPAARYAVSYRDIVDPEAKAHRIAGAKVTIHDRREGDVMAEKTWYSYAPYTTSDRGRAWLHATTCPGLAAAMPTHTIRVFVDQVLKPKQEK